MLLGGGLAGSFAARLESLLDERPVLLPPPTSHRAPSSSMASGARPSGVCTDLRRDKSCCPYDALERELVPLWMPGSDEGTRVPQSGALSPEP